jgi:hypothetical protein
MEYEFEEVPITICGKRGALHAHGTAVLERNSHGLFYIRCIVLDTAEGTLVLDKYAKDPFGREVCEQVYRHLYLDGHVAEAWAAHCESERADAA